MLDDRHRDHVVGVLNPGPNALWRGQVRTELPALLDDMVPFIAGWRIIEIRPQGCFGIEATARVSRLQPLTCPCPGPDRDIRARSAVPTPHPDRQ